MNKIVAAKKTIEEVERARKKAVREEAIAARAM